MDVPAHWTKLDQVIPSRFLAPSAGEVKKTAASVFRKQQMQISAYFTFKILFTTYLMFCFLSVLTKLLAVTDDGGTTPNSKGQHTVIQHVSIAAYTSCSFLHCTSNSVVVLI